MPGTVAAPMEDLEAVWQALVPGLRDYINKNGFPGVVLGLSGGIDSAVTLAVAADALGPDRVEAVMMPFRYTASMSIEDAEAEAQALGVRFGNISIEPLYESFMGALSAEFDGPAPNITRRICRRAVAYCSCRSRIRRTCWSSPPVTKVNWRWNIQPLR